jgi:hypothetical protein
VRVDYLRLPASKRFPRRAKISATYQRFAISYFRGLVRVAGPYDGFTILTGELLRKRVARGARFRIASRNEIESLNRLGAQ